MRAIADFAEKRNMSDWKIESYRALSGYYETHGHRDSAIHYKAKAVMAADSVMNAQIIGNIRDTEYSYEIEKYKSDLLRIEIEHRWHRIIIIILLIALSILLMLGAYTRYHKLRSGWLAKFIYKKNRELTKVHKTDSTEYAENHIAHTNEDIATSSIRENKRTSFDETDNTLFKRISLVAERADEILRPDFTVADMAALTDSQPKQVSACISMMTGKNFSSYIGEYRINESCRRLADIEKYGNLTIEAIANSVGFMSRNHFTKVFKEQVGLSPSEYRKISREN